MRTEESPERKRRRALGRLKQEKRWKAKCGPVTVRYVDPATLKKSGRQDGRPADRGGS